ncbi:hypothetical protein BCR34DRAFT_562398 [Clohesyomyces aquaticus]|uniref:Uncharacterized protein n=1 Tax=Clohesyomyces aquaticus TaxID=1231657 RepID=A0A1Y1ZU62_9PLEO|nr:hypothetical protein BCR34DRAFT_562398 [Clohesyomyces aquaticus]
MKIAVQAFLKVVPDFSLYFPSFTIALLAPYRFWYYARPFLTTVLEELEPKHRDLVELLSNWIEANYSPHYEEAGSKFEAGTVTAEIIDYFVRPGWVLVSHETRRTEDYRCEAWPYGKLVEWKVEDPAKPEEIILLASCMVDCWAYNFDAPSKSWSEH